MGNSLLDVCVYGRRAGITVGEHFRDVQVGKLTLSHLDRWAAALQDAGLDPKLQAPILLPDYTRRKGV